MGQREELNRVYTVIASAILRFHDEWPRDEFHVEDLRRYVLSEVAGIAPDSPGRILRELRLKGRLNYRVKNRRASLYEFLPLPPPVSPQAPVVEPFGDLFPEPDQ